MKKFLYQLRDIIEIEIVATSFFVQFLLQSIASQLFLRMNYSLRRDDRTKSILLLKKE